MVTIEDIENWIRENGDSEGFYDTEALVNHFVNMSKAELIDKACEWLKNNAGSYVWRSGIKVVNCGICDELFNDSKKSMEEKK